MEEPCEGVSMLRCLLSIFTHLSSQNVMSIIAHEYIFNFVSQFKLFQVRSETEKPAYSSRSFLTFSLSAVVELHLHIFLFFLSPFM